jgi:hypothetical protein
LKVDGNTPIPPLATVGGGRRVFEEGLRKEKGLHEKEGRARF